VAPLLASFSSVSAGMGAFVLAATEREATELARRRLAAAAAAAASASAESAAAASAAATLASAVASARSPADAVDALNTALVRSTQREQAGGIELLHPSGAGAVPGATASPRELLGEGVVSSAAPARRLGPSRSEGVVSSAAPARRLGPSRSEGVVSSAAPARRLGPSRSMLRDVRALSRRAVRSCMQAEAAMTLAGIAMHEGAAHASARHGAASGAAGGPSAPAASAQHGAPAAVAMHAEQGHEEEEDDVEDEDGAVSGADEAAAAVNAHRSAVNATLRLAAAAPGTAPDVAMASRAALSATYRAIRHVGQIEKDRWQWMAMDGD
jgi:hypothetical protein